jgi:cytoskeletal protein CcmA (bactofilin family)
LAEERGKIDGDLDVADGFDLFGMVTGNLTVSAGGMAVIHGMVAGNLIVKPRGEAILQGMICGNAVNEGGTLEIYGVVVGVLDASEGTTTVADGAVIQGRDKN